MGYTRKLTTSHVCVCERLFVWHHAVLLYARLLHHSVSPISSDTSLRIFEPHLYTGFQP